MLTAQLSKDIDNRWEACWPVSTLKPLALIDCISYLLFYKKLEERQLIINSDNKPTEGRLYYVNDSNELSWENLCKLNAKEAHILLTKENGVEDLLKNYGRTNLPYSQFLKAPLLVSPSLICLANAIEIIRIIQSKDDAVKGEIFEYLLHKEDIHTTAGQAYCPKEIINTLVSLIHPNGESVCDPSCGNGDLLVSVLSYFSKKDKKITKNQLSKRITGLDSDPVQLRIAAMNLMLHGIDQPRIFDVHAARNSNSFSKEKPALLISNLYFAGVENEDPGTSPPETGSTKKDIYLLNTILNNLIEGSKAAVIIRNYVLSNNILLEARLIRQRLIDNYKIDAIINMPDEAGSLFSGTSILIFHSSVNSYTDKICFYKMKPQSRINETSMLTNVNAESAAYTMDYESATATGFERFLDVHTKPTLTEGLYINVDEIRNNNYNLDANQYRKKIFEPNGMAKKFIAQMETTDSITILQASKFIHVRKRLSVFFQRLEMPGIEKTIIKKFEGLKFKKFKIRKWQNSNIKNLYTSNIGELAKILIRKFQKKNFGDFKILNLGKFKKIQIKLFHKIYKSFTGLQSELKKLTVKKIPLQEIIITGSVAIFVLTFCGIALFFNNGLKGSNNKIGDKELNISLKINTASNTTKNIDTKQNKILTPQQIQAILKDTSGIIRVEDFVNDEEQTVDSSINTSLRDNDNQFKNIKNTTPALSNTAAKIKYRVVDTTYFHNQPSTSSVRKIYLDPHKNAILTPLHESNGFIYIVYTNKLKITSKGWIDKRYLARIE